MVVIVNAIMVGYPSQVQDSLYVLVRIKQGRVPKNTVQLGLRKFPS